MTVLLKKAIKKVSTLSKNEQDELAQLILDEISDEKKWSDKFYKSQSVLSLLADEAVRENIGGKTKDLKF
jgi:hypothetical protein